jgi:hypothetical protein
MSKVIIPSENKPTLKNKNNCYELENVKYIHSYKDFDDIIMQPYLPLFKDEYKKRFLNTCDHMFKKVGFGIFVYILKGKIHTFQIFANTTEIKPGSNNLINKTNKNKTKNKNKTNKNKNKNKTKKCLKNKKEWGFPYCMISCNNNWWNGFYSNYINIYFDMLTTCLKKTTFTTCFFINLYDIPVLYNKKCKQFIFNDVVCKNNPIQSDQYIPVLSGATTQNHYDKCLIYVDAWEIISKKKFMDKFSNTCKNKYTDYLSNINQTWDNKKNTLIFRGKNNSCYKNDFKKNDRLKILEIFNNINIDNNSNNSITIDVGLTNNSNTFSSNEQTEFFKTKIPMNEQSNCKYILDIDGFVTPWRLCFELCYNSCIILFQSKYYSWFYDKLEHMKNVYIIDINSKTFKKDIYECLLLLQNNDNIGKKIANESTKLYNEIMNIKYVKKYMYALLSEPDFDLLLP